MKIYKIREILEKLENCIKYKKPFSHLRFGDGGIKLLHSLYYNDREQILQICKREGIPFEKIVYIYELWGYYARRADFIDTPQVYFDGEFWPRIKTKTKKISEKTLERMLMWKELYYNAEFDNRNFCNPESNYLMILNNIKPNLIDIMKNRKICLITAVPQVSSIFKKFNYDVDIFSIVGHYQNQYENSFSKVVSFISNCSTEYDLFLVAAGELGRIYTGIIKQNNGRAIDIGFVVEFWNGNDLHTRLQVFMERDKDKYMELCLNEEGRKYEGAI